MKPNSRIFLGLLSILLMACGGQISNSGLPDPNPLPPTTRVMYTAGDQEQGVQLWTSDGTPQGTRVLKIINKQGLVSPMDYQSWAFTNVQATPFTLWRGNYWFFANDSVHGAELWTSDGTSDGTQMVKDLSPGPGNAVELSVSDLRIHSTQNGLYFVASPISNSGPGYGRNLWQSDGTASGTKLIPRFDPSQEIEAPFWPTPIGMGIAFMGRGNRQFADLTLLATEVGRSASWQLQTMLGLERPFRLGPNLLFWGSPWSETDKKWVFGLWNGGNNGTDLVPLIHKIDSKIWWVWPHWNEDMSYQESNGLVLFELEDYAQQEGKRSSLWRTDGTPQGTFKLLDTANPTGHIARCSTYFQGKWFFMADDGVRGMELWCSDGTTQGTRLFKDLLPGPEGSFPGASLPNRLCTGGFYEFKGNLFFGANADGTHKLWVSDGTPEGTHPVMDASQPKDSSPVWPAAYCAVGDTLYFSATTVIEGSNRQLWRTDGTPAGTRQVSNHDFLNKLNPIWTIVPSPKP